VNVSNSKSPDELLLDEFGSYYLADELDDWTDAEFVQQIPEKAAESAKRLLWAGGRGAAAQIISTLQAIAGDRQHSLHEHISEHTLIDWRDEEAWPVFQKLAAAIAQELGQGKGHPAAAAGLE
jgi:hypothetical protein